MQINNLQRDAKIPEHPFLSFFVPELGFGMENKTQKQLVIVKLLA